MQPIIDPAIFDLSDTDPAALAAKIEALFEVEKLAKERSRQTAGRLVTRLLPTCSEIAWTAEYEASGEGRFYTQVDSVALHFADRADGEFPARNDAEFALGIQFPDGPDVEQDAGSEESFAACAYANELGITPDDYGYLLAAIKTIVWSEPDNEQFIPTHDTTARPCAGLACA